MVQKSKGHKNQYKIKGRPILSLIIGLSFFTVVLLAAMLSAAKDNKHQGSLFASNTQLGKQITPTLSPSEDKILAVVKAIDSVDKRITLYDVNHQNTIDLNYTGGSNITDKYGKLISMSQIEAGSMVDAAYLEDKSKLTDMNLSTRAWEYVGVNNFTIDQEEGSMKIGKQKYKLGEEVQVLNGDQFVPVSTLTEQDELTVWGYEETIWCMVVTRGHGTVVLEDYKDFLGDFITIGYEAIQQITDNMEIKVREGSFNLTVDNGAFSATKNITVNRNMTTYVSLSDLGPGINKTSNIIFEIAPFGAELYINGVLTSYANPIELEYGEYLIKVAMGGYTSYEGTLIVDSAGKTIKIDLPESSSQDAVNVSETDNTGTGITESKTDNTGTGITESGADTTNNGTGSMDTSTNTTGSNTSDTNTNAASDASNKNIDIKHQIYVQKPVGASVYIDGEYKCISPGNFQKIIGTHVITFIKEGYKTMSYTIEVSDDNLDVYYSFADLVAK